MGTLLKQTELVMSEIFSLSDSEKLKNTFIETIAQIRTCVTSGLRVESKHIDDFINMACYLSDNSAAQRDKIILLMEAFERQQNFKLVPSCSATDTPPQVQRPNVLEA